MRAAPLRAVCVSALPARSGGLEVPPPAVEPEAAPLS